MSPFVGTVRDFPAGQLTHAPLEVAPTALVVKPLEHDTQSLTSLSLYLPSGHGWQLPSTIAAPKPAGHDTVQLATLVAASPGGVVWPLGHCIIGTSPLPQ